MLLLVPVSSLVMFGVLVHGCCFGFLWAVAPGKPDVLSNRKMIIIYFKPWVLPSWSALLARWLTGHTVLSFLCMAHQGDHCFDFTHGIGIIPCIVCASLLIALLIELLTALLIALLIALVIILVIGMLIYSLLCLLLCS